MTSHYLLFHNGEQYRSIRGAYVIVFHGDVIVSTDIGAIAPMRGSALSALTPAGYGELKLASSIPEEVLTCGSSLLLACF
jgi:hypothetical protein